MTASCLTDKLSRYTQGGLSEVGQIGIENWERYYFPTDPSDQIYIVDQNYQHRLDLIANAFYQEPKLDWFLAQYNNLLDMYAEVSIGKQLLIPILTRVQSLLNYKLGGTPSTVIVNNILPPIIL